MLAKNRRLLGWRASVIKLPNTRGKKTSPACLAGEPAHLEGSLSNASHEREGQVLCLQERHGSAVYDNKHVGDVVGLATFWSQEFFSRDIGIVPEECTLLPRSHDA